MGGADNRITASLESQGGCFPTLVIARSFDCTISRWSSSHFVSKLAPFGSPETSTVQQRICPGQGLDFGIRFYISLGQETGPPFHCKCGCIDGMIEAVAARSCSRILGGSIEHLNIYFKKSFSPSLED